MELIITPSFCTDLLKVPQKDQQKVTRAIPQIQIDPFTGGGHTRKCFKQKFSNVYRYRTGDYRIVYCVGEKCLRFLGVGRRSDIYERFKADPDIDSISAGDLSDAEPKPITTTVFDKPRITKPRSGEDGSPTPSESGIEKGPDSARLLKELLRQWGIPKDKIETILRCESIEDIFALDIEDRIKDVVLRWDRPAKVQEVIEEPVYDLPSPEHLEKYLAGTLKGFLLKLDPEQVKVARKNLNGPTLVKGGPGTGKSLVALYRIRNLMQPDAQKNLFNEAPPKTLFVTYTTTLIQASKQLLAPLLGKTMKHVEVNNLDKIVRRIAARTGDDFNPADEKHKIDALKEALSYCEKKEKEHTPTIRTILNRVSLDYLIDEFDWVIEGREIYDLDTYLREDRGGRGTALDQNARRVLWALHQRYLKMLLKNKRSTWDQLRTKALKVMSGGGAELPKYDVVIVDEAQDITPVGLRLCMALCKEPNGFYMTADSGQSIYNRGFSWKRVDEAMNIRGRTTVLKFNYRSTRQIMEAALQPLKDNGGGDPETADTVPILEGPKPKLLVSRSLEEQILKTIDFILQSSEDLKLSLSAGAVLVRSNKTGEEFAKALSEKGLPAELVKGEKFDFDQKKVKVMTIHSAKGLEFPFVAIVRVDADQIPAVWHITDLDEKNARVADERRLLSVGMSRAMRRLALIFDYKKPSELVGEINKELWDDAV